MDFPNIPGMMRLRYPRPPLCPSPTAVSHPQIPRRSRIIKRMIGLLMIGLIALSTTGCATWINGRSPKLSLHEPGVLLLSKENEVVEIESEYELSAKWLVAGRLDSTRALIDGKSKPVTASVVEANKLWMVLKSPSWKERKDLPEEYLNSRDLYITMLSGSDKGPVIGIPLAQIQEIRLYRRDEEGESRTVAESIVSGAAGGIGFGLAENCWAFEDRNLDNLYPDELPDLVETLVMTSIAAVVGAVGLPLYDHLIHPHWKARKEKAARLKKGWWGWAQPLSIGEDDYTISVKKR